MKSLNISTFVATLLLAFGVLTMNGQNVKPYVNKVNPDATARKTKSGIVIVGSAPHVIAFSPYGGSSSAGANYADVANKYQAALGSNVKVYCMPVPSASEFYSPKSASAWNKSQCPTINNIFSHLNRGVTGVDVYTTLGQHAAEHIYSRTDHHWSPLGAYYAAREFARVAKVPFRDLKSYEAHTVSGYVGSMSTYSKDAAVKGSPEDFVYYTPRDAKYTTTRTIYTVKGKRVISEKVESPSRFFIPFKGSGAYCTFMGGDHNTTKVVTNVKNGRRLLVIKDSFGNPVPGFLFYSFEQVHVIDFRYFNKNVKEYVRDNGITDVLMVNALSLAVSQGTCSRYMTMLNQ